MPAGTHAQLARLRRQRARVEAAIDAAEAAQDHQRLATLQVELAGLCRRIEAVGRVLHHPFPLAA